MNDHEELTYVYAVVRDTPRLRAALGDIRGISGSAPFLLRDEEEDPGPGHGSAQAVAFVAGRVPKREFDEPTLKDRFEDLEWLEGVARTHHEVVQLVARHGTVLPLRLATVYQNDARARGALSAQRRAFTERLTLLSGQSELGIKLYISPTRGSRSGGDTATEDAASGSEDAAALSPGKAYLRRRRAQHSAQEVRYGNAQQAAERVEALASRFSTHRVRHPAQSGALAGPEENVLNDAYLVPDERTEEFRAALAEAIDDVDGVRIEVTGPWAPYSFAMPAPPADPSPPDAHTSPAADPSAPADPSPSPGTSASLDGPAP
ncbi:GvpL/GvpF family gas vesicle protein [Streptomyces sp. NPDC090127]|uniref:GvpL/GvpF family gas vesicle protein n=1 Tax=Streptomyces sp. NPDC090127 TaxID=3365953 RepID=UPI0038027199